MGIPSLSTLIHDDGQLRLPFRLFWNETERRPRAPIRFCAGVVLIFLFATVGSQYRIEPFVGNAPLIGAANRLVWVLPQAVTILLGIVLVSWLLDRREVVDLGLNIDSSWGREFVGGTVLGVGITSASVAVALLAGGIRITGIQVTGGLFSWLGLVLGAIVFQLLFVVPEELFVRGYVITNIIEGLNGIPSIPRWLAAGIGISVASFLFHVTHSGRGRVFALMAGGIAVLLGVGYVLSGSLSVPIGIHFGFNIGGVILGTNTQPASILQLKATSTVVDSLILPAGMVVTRLAGAVLGVFLLLWWFHATHGRLRIAPSIVRPTLRWNSKES